MHPSKSVSIVQKHFDSISQQYDEFAFLQNLVLKELLDRLELLNIDVTKVLDLGAGTGQSNLSLRSLFPKASLLLLDNSQSMLAISKKKLNWKQRLLKQVSFHQAQANQTALMDESIDLVVSNLVLPYIEEAEEVFHEMQRVTRPDGVFCFTSFGPDTLIEFQTILSNVPKQHASIQLGHLIDMHIVGDNLLKAGFREPVMDVEKVTLSFSNFDSLWDELYYTGVILGDYEQKTKAFIAAEYEQYRNDDGLPVSFEIVYGQAWANSNQTLKEKAEFQRDGVFSFPVEQLKRR